MHEGLGRLTAVFVKLASVALSQGWIGRAKVAHQAVLIVRRKASVTTPLHACVQGAIERLSRSDRHVTLRVGSTDIGIVFPFRDQKNTNLVRDSTQSMRLSCFGPAYVHSHHLKSPAHFLLPAWALRAWNCCPGS